MVNPPPCALQPPANKSKLVAVADRELPVVAGAVAAGVAVWRRALAGEVGWLAVCVDEDARPGDWLPLARTAAPAPATAARTAAAERMATVRRDRRCLVGTVRPGGCMSGKLGWPTATGVVEVASPPPSGGRLPRVRVSGNRSSSGGGAESGCPTTAVGDGRRLAARPGAAWSVRQVARARPTAWASGR
jgi:hypothetical protein